jgi:hypothetical protein
MTEQHGDYLVAVSKITAMQTVDTLQKPKTAINPDNETLEYIPWGSSNSYPQDIIKEFDKAPTIKRALNTWAELNYSGGICYGVPDFDKKTGKYTAWNRIIDLEIESWLRRSNFNKYLIEALVDLAYFKNIFPAVMLRNDRKYISMIYTRPAEQCRYAKPNATTGYSEKIYVSARWLYGAGPGQEDTMSFPIIDPYYAPEDNLRNMKGVYEAIYPVNFPSPGKDFYQLASVDTLLRSGWLEVAKSIPKFKKALFENQITLKYMIEISIEYLKIKYHDWDAKPELKKTRFTEMKTEIDTYLAGTDNTGKTYIYTSYIGPEGKEVPGVKITAMDNKIKGDLFIDDSAEATAHVLNEAGIDQSITGFNPGKGMGAGSGSDKRITYNIHMLLNKVHQDAILEPLNNLIAVYNGWWDKYPGLTFKFNNEMLTTLDTGASKQADKVNENQAPK